MSRTLSRFVLFIPDRFVRKLKAVNSRGARLEPAGQPEVKWLTPTTSIMTSVPTFLGMEYLYAGCFSHKYLQVKVYYI